MKKLLFLVGATLFSAAAYAQNSAIYKAEALDQKGDYEGAAALLEEALQNPKTTKFAEMYHQAAEANAKIFNAELMKAARGLPFDTAKFTGTLDKCIDFYNKSHAADIAPDEKGRVKSKYVELNHARLLAMIDYYNYAAMFMYQSHDTARAIAYFEKYMDMPHNPIFSQHETDSIYAAKQQAYSQTALNLATLNYTRKDWTDALKYADIALKDTLGTRDLYLIKMQSHANLKDSVSWLNTIKEAVAKTEDEGFMQNLLYYYVTHNDVTGAESMANELVTASPSSKAAWYMKGCVELNLKKDYVAARECFEKALAIDPDYAEANVNIATTYVNQVISDSQAGKFKYVGTGKSILPAQEKEYKAEVALVQSYYKKAQPYMEKVRALMPDNPRVWAYTLRMIYENLQLKDQKAEIDAIIEGMK